MDAPLRLLPPRLSHCGPWQAGLPGERAVHASGLVHFDAAALLACNMLATGLTKKAYVLSRLVELRRWCQAHPRVNNLQTGWQGTGVVEESHWVLHANALSISC